MSFPLTPLHFLPSLSPNTEFKGSPEYATWNVLHHTSFRNYASISLQVPSNLSILLGPIYAGWQATALHSAATRGGDITFREH
jgi:hypothetical protein